MSSSTRISLSAFINYLGSGDFEYLPKKNTDYYLIEESAKIDFEVNEKISELKGFYFSRGIEFIGCNFHNGLSIVNCKGGGQIKFFNCRSNKLKNEDPRPGLHLQDVDFDHLTLNLCIFPNGFQINKAHQKNENNKLSSLTIQKSSFEEMGVTLDSTTINQNLEIKNVIESKNLKFNNLEIGHNLSLYHVEAEEITFSGENSNFNSNVSLSRLISKNVSFEHGKIFGDLKISEPRIDKKLIFNGLFINGNSTILANEVIKFKELNKSGNFLVNIPELKIGSSEFNGGLLLDGSNLASKSISIEFSPKLKGRLVFSNLKLGELQLKGTNSESNVYFRNMGFEKVLIDDLLNLKSISFSNLNEEYTKSQNSSFKILDSDMGNWELANFNFDAFKKIIWKDSQIAGLRTSAVGWFKDSKLESEGEYEPSTCLRRREFYRQLKQSSEKQGDKINELEFKRRELKAYKAALKIRKEKKVDRFTIWTGGSNNHGQDWIKPLLLIIGISIAFYPFLIISIDPEISWSWFWSLEEWNRFSQGVRQNFSVFWQLFNPTRRLSDLFPTQTLKASVHFLDSLHRIVLAFFIFQIISAFRKFVK